MKKIIDEYIEYTKKSIIQYLKMIFLNNYDPEIAEEFLITYMNVRYYNVYNGNKSKRAFYLRVTDEIDRKYEILINDFRAKAKKQKITIDIREEMENKLNSMREVFLLMIFWDNVKDLDNLNNNEDLKATIGKVEKIRNKYFKMKIDNDFRKNLYSKIKDDLIRKDVYLDNLSSKFFNLEFKKAKKENNIYYTSVKHNINFPMVYSDAIIEKVYKEDTVAEDILKVTFTLLSAVIIRDVERGNFKDVYIVDFPYSIISKNRKMENVLGLINTQILQDKIYLKVMYEDYLKNIDIFKRFVTKGYKFVIELDKGFTKMSDLKQLQVFKYIILTNKTKLYKEVQEDKKYKNILEK